MLRAAGGRKSNLHYKDLTSERREVTSHPLEGVIELGETQEGGESHTTRGDLVQEVPDAILEQASSMLGSINLEKKRLSGAQVRQMAKARALAEGRDVKKRKRKPKMKGANLSDGQPGTSREVGVALPNPTPIHSKTASLVGTVSKVKVRAADDLSKAYGTPKRAREAISTPSSTRERSLQKSGSREELQVTPETRLLKTYRDRAIAEPLPQSRWW